MTPTSSSEEAVELWDDDLALLLGDADDSAYKSSPKTIRAALASRRQPSRLWSAATSAQRSSRRATAIVSQSCCGTPLADIAQWKDTSSPHLPPVLRMSES